MGKVNCATATQDKEEEREESLKNEARKTSKWCVDIMRVIDIALDVTGETFGCDSLEAP